MQNIKILALHKNELNAIFDEPNILGKVREQEDLASMIMDSSLYDDYDTTEVVVNRDRMLKRG